MFALKSHKQHFLYLIIVCILLFVSGCDSGIKPNYFIGIFRDEGDIDRLSTCLQSMPVIDEDGNIIITANSQCLVDLSKRDISDPNMDVLFSEILNDPESYLDKYLTFEAIVKKILSSSHIELFTNRKQMEFDIIVHHGVNLYWIDKDGEEQDMLPNQKYEFQVRIYEIKITENGIWKIYSEMLSTTTRKLVNPPVLIIEPAIENK